MIPSIGNNQIAYAARNFREGGGGRVRVSSEGANGGMFPRENFRKC